MTARYEISIYWSHDDDAYIAEGRDLPGCMVDGRSYQEALAAAEVAYEEWIATAKELGRQIPAHRSRRASA